jgi:nucleoside-diphosphate-sugar epimerase
MTSQLDLTDFTVLGAEGFIGSNLINHLSKDGSRIYAPKKNTSDFTNVQHGHIIYCIGLTSDFRRRPLDTMQAHVCILRELLERVEFKSLTYLSSTRVYHGSSSTKESDKLSMNPENIEDLYGISKLAGESLCHHSGRQNVKIVRLSNIVGYRKDSDLFIDQLLHEIVNHNTLTLKSSLLSRKDYLYIDDAVNAIASLALTNNTGCFNVAYGNNISNQTIIDQLNENFDFKLTIEKNAPVIDFPIINTEKIRKTIHFNPSPFSDYFSEFINCYKKRKGIK